MKLYKLFIVLLIFSLLLTFAGCISWSKKYDDIVPEDISSVEFYDLCDSDQRGSGFHKAITPVYSLPDEQLDNFLNALSTIRFTDGIILLPVAWDPSFDYGKWVVRLNYADGAYTFLSDHGFGESYDANNNLISSNHYGCDSDEWSALIIQFLPEDLL